MEQQASAGDFKKNVLLLKPGDVTKRGDHVLTPTLNILSKLRKTEQFKRDVVFSRNMSAVDVTKKLVEAFPALENKRFSCAKRDNRESANLNFKGDRHVWDGESIKKLPGSSAMYIVVEDETSQVQAAANETDCLSADQRPSSFTPLDLEGVNPGRFDDYWKDLVDVLNEDCKNSDGLRSRQSQTMQMVSGRRISESSERYRIVVNNDEISETGYSSGANSSQPQGFSQETEATDTTQSSFRLYQARETAYSSDEGSSSREQTFDLTINPESCRPEGGKSFSMEFNKSLPSSVTSAWAIFGPYGRVKVSRSYDEDCTLFGKKIPPGQPGTIIVKITTEGGAYLGETDFTYKNPKKKLIHQGLSNKRKLDELYAAVKDLEKKVKQIQQGDNDKETQTSSFEQGLINQGKNLKPERILKLLIYAAAEAGAMRLIETIFRLPAGRIVFEVYKDDSALPEDIAEENGHREVAVYLRGVTERYSEEHCTSPDQSTIAEFDWLKLANALEGIKLKHTGPSSYKDLNQIWEDETGYSADGETSSSGSEKDISHSEDELNKINTCKDHPYHEGGKRSLGNSRGSYCDSREKRSDLEASKRNLCKDLDPSHQLTEIDIFEGQLPKQIGLKWKDLARKLGFLQDFITVIEEENRHITQNCCIGLLVRWIHYMGREATVGKLQDALERMKSENVAENLISDLDPSHQLTESDIYERQLPEQIGLKWKDLARKLGFLQSSINMIEEKRHITKECCIELLVQWIQKMGSKATAGKLQNALERMKKKNVVENLISDLDPNHQLTESDIHERQLPEQIGLKWKDLARKLGFLQSSINMIEEKRRITKECCIELLVEWIQKMGREATAGKLQEALERMKNKNVVENLISDLDPSQQLTESDIYERQLPEQIGLKWKDLARELGFAQDTINLIEEEKRHITKECCIELLLHWIRDMGRQATAGKLQGALERMKSKNVAENLISDLDPSHQLTEVYIHERQLPEQIGLKWKDLAKRLGFLQSTINMIEEEKRHITKECCIELLLQWINCMGREATVGKLQDALERMKSKNVAENLISDLDPSHQLTESDIHERQLSEQIGLKWKDLARKLGFLQGTINMIEEEKRHITKECCTELLLQWINCMGREATIGKLQDALERVKSKNVVENLISGKIESELPVGAAGGTYPPVESHSVEGSHISACGGSDDRSNRVGTTQLGEIKYTLDDKMAAAAEKGTDTDSCEVYVNGRNSKGNLLQRENLRAVEQGETGSELQLLAASGILPPVGSDSLAGSHVSASGGGDDKSNPGGTTQPGEVKHILDDKVAAAAEKETDATPSDVYANGRIRNEHLLQGKNSVERERVVNEDHSLETKEIDKAPSEMIPPDGIGCRPLTPLTEIGSEGTSNTDTKLMKIPFGKTQPRVPPDGMRQTLTILSEQAMDKETTTFSAPYHNHRDTAPSSLVNPPDGLSVQPSSLPNGVVSGGGRGIETNTASLPSKNQRDITPSRRFPSSGLGVFQPMIKTSAIVHSKAAELPCKSDKDKTSRIRVSPVTTDGNVNINTSVMALIIKNGIDRTQSGVNTPSELSARASPVTINAVPEGASNDVPAVAKKEDYRELKRYNSELLPKAMQKKRKFKPSDPLAKTILDCPDLLEPLSRCLDKEYKYTSCKNWKNVAEHFDIEEQEYQNFNCSHVHSSTEVMFEYLQVKRPEITIGDVKDALHSIAREDVVRVLLNYEQTHGMGDNGTLVCSLFDSDPDIIGEIAFLLDIKKKGLKNWSHLAASLEIPRKDFILFETCNSEYPAAERLFELVKIKYPRTTVRDLKRHLDAIERQDVIFAIRECTTVTEDSLLKDLMEDFDVMEKVCELLNQRQRTKRVKNWSHLGRRYGIKKECLDDISASQEEIVCPTEALFQYLSVSKSYSTLADLIWAIHLIDRDDALEVLDVYLEDGCTAELLKVCNCERCEKA